MIKSLPWIAAAAGVAAAVYFLKNMPAPQHATGSSTVEDAARRTSAWGSKQRITGTGGNLMGRVKETLGRATGNENMMNEGAFDQVAGAVKDTAGELAQAAGQTIHDLNR